MELGAGARHRAKFLTMDIREVEAVREHREMIVKKFGGLDILVNNAGIYQKPDLTMFSAQSKEIMLTNYWGTKNVITAFYDDFNPNSRIVNITSNLAHVKSAVSKEEEELKDCAREKFATAESAAELDGLVCQFQIHASLGTWKKEGWPTCAYSVSKMAINAYTRILQRNFDESKREDIVVNAVYPATKHSKVPQEGIDLMEDEDGARFVFYMATVMPNSHGVFPRGTVVWDNTRVVHCGHHLTFNNKLSSY